MTSNISYFYQSIIKTNVELPFFISHISAGFPSPADDFVDKKLDLNDLLIEHPSATFFVKVSGDSMILAGIREGDLVIIDRSKSPINGSIVLAVVNGEFLIKRFVQENQKVILRAENDHYPDIIISEYMDFEIWGVATNVIHSLT